MDEVYEDCGACGSENSLIKLIGMPIIVKNRTDTRSSVGSLTKEYIELNKEILEDEKNKAREENYDPPWTYFNCYFDIIYSF